MVTKVPPVYLLVSSLLLISSRALMSAIKHWCWYLERVQRPPRQRHSGLPPLRCPSALYKNQDEATEATRKKCAQASILASKWKPWKRPLQQKAASGLCSHAKHINGANTMLLSLMSVSSFFLFFGNISHENTSDLTPVLVVVIMAFDHQAIWAPH